MKKLFLFLTILLSLAAQSQISYTVLPASDGGIYQPSATKYKGGDRIVLKGNYTYIFLEGLKGDTLNPILIVPDGLVTVSQHFDLKSCKYVKIDGGPDKNIVVDQNNPSSNRDGTNIHGYSDHIEITNVIYRNSGYGIWCKNEHDDLIDTNVSKHVLRYISVHDCEFYNIGQHGIGYFGATEWPNKTRPVTINGVNYYPNPSLLGDIKVYNNKVVGCGRNGFMLCIAPIGKNEVYNNDISKTGLEPNQDQQGSGLQFGGFTSVYAHDNKIDYSLLWGIRSFGGANVRLENNIITNSGNNGQWSPTSWPAGYTLTNWNEGPANIAIGPEANFSATGTKMKYSINGNSLSSPGTRGVNIRIWPGNYSDSNTICNNGSAIIKVDAGIVYKSDCSVSTPPPVIVTPPPVVIPPVVKTIFHKGYFTGTDGKRFYYIMYTDKTYVQTTSKYVPL